MTIVSDVRTQYNQGGRVGTTFKDGTYVRKVELRPGRVIVVNTVEGQELWRDGSLMPLSDFAIQSLSAEISSFSGTLVVTAFGFTVNTQDSRVVVVTTGYTAQPEVKYGG